jgi:hypothetical protein
VEALLHSFLTSALDLGERWAFTPGKKKTSVPLQYEAGWAPEPVRTWCKIFFASAGIEHLVIVLRTCYLKQSCLLLTSKTYRSCCREPEEASGWMVWSSNPGRGKRFVFPKTFTPALGFTQSVVQWVPGFSARKQSGRGEKLQLTCIWCRG